MASKQLHHATSSVTSPFSNSSSSPESFALETKFIVLNFMGRNPHERHPGCVYSSTSSAGSDSDPFKFKHRKTNKSFPTSPRSHKLGQLDQSFHTSEDNVSYRYQKESKRIHFTDSSNESFPEHVRIEKPLRASFSDEHLKKRHFKSQSLDHGLSQGRYFLDSDSSPVSVPVNQNFAGSTPFENYRQSRTESELSSDACNLSYTSDADDEYESTTSSLINSFTDIYVRGNKQELVVPRLSTLLSESEIETDVSTVACDTSAERNDVTAQDDDNVFQVTDRTKNLKISTDREEKANGDGHHLQPLIENTDATSPNQNSLTEGDAHVSRSLPGLSLCRTLSVDESTGSEIVRRKADRSKLRLIIKDQQEWEEEQKYQMQQVLAVVEDEVNSEMVTLESEVEEAIKRNVISPAESPFIAPLSPHSEAAMTLARIGDDIKEFYGDRLDIAVSGLIGEQETSFTYENFRCMACSIIDQVLPGWRQVALLLVYGQSVAWRVAEFGYREFGELVNNTVRLISELTADFIASQGGWGAVTQYESSLSSSVSPRRSSSDELSPRNSLNRRSSKKQSNTTSLYTSFTIPVHDRPSSDHVTFVPPPDESAVDNTVIFATHRRQNSCVENRSVSLADIEMTFSPSNESANNQVTFLTLNQSCDNHVGLDSSVDSPVREGPQTGHKNGENNNSLFLIKNGNDNEDMCRNDPSIIKNLSQEDCCIGQLPSLETEIKVSIDNHDSVATADCQANETGNNLPVLQYNNSSMSLDSEAQANISSNNNSRFVATIVVPNNPATNMEQLVEYEEESESNEDSVSSDNLPDGRNIFDRYFNVGAFLSIGVCAIAIIATIATSRK